MNLGAVTVEYCAETASDLDQTPAICNTGLRRSSNPPVGAPMSAMQPQIRRACAPFLWAWAALLVIGCAEDAPVASLSLAGGSADAGAEVAEVAAGGEDGGGDGSALGEDGGAPRVGDALARDPDGALTGDVVEPVDGVIAGDAAGSTDAGAPPDGVAAEDALAATDGGPAADAGPVADSAVVADGVVVADAGSGQDAIIPVDSGVATDAGSADAGPAVDAVAPVDSGPAVDVGPPKDTGPAPDGGIAVDAGPKPDTATGPVCGNNVCEPGESTQNCGGDCKGGGDFSWTCGDSKCDIGEQFYCQKDCPGPQCGDSKCQYPENATNCSKDCKASSWVCGDNKCDIGEQFYCQKDCAKDPEKCMADKCSSQLNACSKDPVCDKAVECALKCGTDWGCLQGCFPNGISANPAANALLTCGQKAGCF